MGPGPSFIDYPPWATEIPTLRCPSDPGTGLPSLGRTNYAACLGDSPLRGSHGPFDRSLESTQVQAEKTRGGQRGVFVPRQQMRFRDILDGLSNTIMAGEVATDLGDLNKRTRPKTNLTMAGERSGAPGLPFTPSGSPSLCTNTDIDPLRPQFWSSDADTVAESKGRGYRWASGHPTFTVINTLSPPNSPTCLFTRREWGGIPNNSAVYAYARTGVLPPSSQHPGGCHILMGDGAVRFITYSIEAGNQQNRPVGQNGRDVDNNVAGAMSPYGLWGALGTRASKEVIDDDF